MFSVAKIGNPAVTLPTIGIFNISLLVEFNSTISKALGFVGSLLINPFFSNLFKCPWTVDVDFNETASQISLTEGGYPLFSVYVFKNSYISFCLSLLSNITTPLLKNYIIF